VPPPVTSDDSNRDANLLSWSTCGDKRDAYSFGEDLSSIPMVGPIHSQQIDPHDQVGWHAYRDSSIPGPVLIASHDTGMYGLDGRSATPLVVQEGPDDRSDFQAGWRVNDSQPSKQPTVID
jgi:hypothetical protein